MREHAVPLILVVVVATGIYACALRVDFVWDDIPYVANNVHIREFGTPLRFFGPEYWGKIRDAQSTPRGYRPVTEVSFAVDYAIWRLKPVGYHLTNVLLHAASCALSYLLAYRLFGHRRPAVFSALLFAAHPVHTEAVVWAKARAEMLALLFIVLAVLLYLRYARSAPSARSVYLLVGSMTAGAGAVCSKASAVVLPGLLILCAWCMLPRGRLRAGAFAVLPMIGVVAAFLAAYFVMPQPPQSTILAGTLGSSALGGLEIAGAYLRLLVAPVGLCLQHGFEVTRSILHPPVLQGFGLVAALLTGTVFALRRSRAAFFALGWLLIALIPALALKFVGRPIAELRAYAPSLGFCLLLGLALYRLPAVAGPAHARRLARLGTVLCVLLVGTYGGLSVARTLRWGDPLALWSDTLAKNPESWHAHERLGMLAEERGRLGEAAQHFVVLVDMAPYDPAPLRHLATLYQRAGRWDQAALCYERLLAFEPDSVMMLVDLGAAHLASGQPQEAARRLEAATRLDPTCMAAYYNLGIALTCYGEDSGAMAALEQAVRLAPDVKQPHEALADLYAAMGERELATAEYKECLRIDPNDGAARLALEKQREALGQYDQ